MKPKNFRDPNYIKLRTLMMKKELKSRKKQFLQIKYSDPGLILRLIRELHETDSAEVQMKVNLYLQNAASCDISFIIEENNRIPEATVRVIGTSKLTSKIIFQINNEFIKRLRKAEEPLVIHDCFIDPILLENIKQILCVSYSKNFRNFLVVPIYHPYKKRVIFYSVLVNLKPMPERLDRYIGLVGECYRYCHEVVLNSIRCDEEKYFHKKYRDILSKSLDSMQNLDNLEALIHSIRSTALSIFVAERCRIFIVERNHLSTRINEYGQAFDTSDEIIHDIRIPFGIGISGTVAETSKIYNCIDPSKDPLYRNTLEMPTHKHSRNILSFPILLYTGVFGVVQVHDKIDACHFSGADEVFARFLGPLFGIQLHICLRKKKLWDAINRRSMIEELFLQDSKNADSDEVNLVINCNKKHEYTDFLSYTFLPAGIDPKDVICICLRTFEEYGLLAKYTIDRRNFIKFLIKIRNRHYNYPLHNWQHSFCAFHFLHCVVKKEELIEKEQVNDVELFAMLLAALCHSMEFRGGTSPYQPTTGTVLASLYSTPGSLLQFYSVAQLVRIMTSKDCTIADYMEPGEYRECIKQLDQMFLYMDLAYHVSNRQNLESIGKTYNIKNQEHNKALHSVVLICAELSDYCKDFEYCNNFSNATLEEFYNPNTVHCEGVIDITGFTDNIQLKKVELQIQFTKDVCQEAFGILSTFLPRTMQCLEIVQQNSLSFRAKKDAVIQEQMEQL